jgi:hypothetical protein
LSLELVSVDPDVSYAAEAVRLSILSLENVRFARDENIIIHVYRKAGMSSQVSAAGIAGGGGCSDMLSSPDPAAGAALTRSPDVDVVTFTRLTATGREMGVAGREEFLERNTESVAVPVFGAS